jgi:hypothetical protein
MVYILKETLEKAKERMTKNLEEAIILKGFEQ